MKFTQNAIDQLHKVSNGNPMRVRLQAGGCNGLTRELLDNQSIDPKWDIAYSLVTSDNSVVKVAIDLKSNKLLEDTTLDWQSSLFHKEFVWETEQPVNSCSCGKSISLKKD